MLKQINLVASHCGVFKVRPVSVTTEGRVQFSGISVGEPPVQPVHVVQMDVCHVTIEMDWTSSPLEEYTPLSLSLSLPLIFSLRIINHENHL